MISPSSIVNLKALSRIEDVLKDYIEIKKKGTNWVGCCPFHAEKSPSFTINPVGQYYKCFGCGKSGDVFRFLIEHTNITFFAAVDAVAKFYNFELEIEGVRKEYIAPIPRLEKLRPEIISRFEQRGISNNTLLRFQVTEAVTWMPKANKEVPVICFNYYRNTELVNIKYRGAEKDFMMNKGSELIFYNLDALHQSTTAIIVEGEIDCMSMYEAGFYNVVSVPNGAAGSKLDYLDNCWQYFEDKTEIILMTDNDEPGIKLREELARRLGKNRCLKAEYPEDCKDANDILIKHGKEVLRRIATEATEWPIEGILTMSDMYLDVMDMYENGYPESTKAGIDGFDQLLTFGEGQLTTVTGTPGSGKSEFLDFIMTSLSKFNNWRFGVCSFENQPSAFHVTKLAEKITGKAFAMRDNPYSRMNKAQLEQAIDVIEDAFFFININKIDVTLEGILEKAKELVIRKGIRALLIDPWNYIEHKVPPGYTETQYISEALTALKAFGITHGIHIFLVAHPTKMKKDLGTGKYEIPTLYHISGSAHFFNKTDNGFTIVRDFQTNEVSVYVQKVRFSWAGKVGQADFRYNLETRQYQYIDK